MKELQPVRERNNICTQLDDDLKEKAIWVARLTNGLTVYQDDYRTKYDEPIAWKRLKRYLEQKRVGIYALSIQFRSHVVNIAINPEGFYFSYGVGQLQGVERSDEFYVCGPVYNRIAHVSWYHIPDLEVFKLEKKEIDSCLSDCYIINPS